MRRYFFGLLIVTSVCFGGPSGAPAKLKVIRTIPHSGYSEGLDFHGGYLWHSLPKEFVKIDPKDGSVVKRFPPASAYNESLSWFKGNLFVASYSDNGFYKGTLNGDTLSFERVGSVPEAHGWGVTNDGVDLFVTGNYSRHVYRLDAKTFAIKNTLVTDVNDVEDLAWDGTSLWASSYTQYRGTIFRIDPVTGETSHYSEIPKPDDCPVIDGIASVGDTLWITGKNCTVIYNVKTPRIERAISKTRKP